MDGFSIWRQKSTRGEMLRSIRTEMGLTARDLSLRIGACSGRVSLLENGGCRFTMHWLERIAAGLEMTPAALLARMEVEQGAPADTASARRAKNLRRVREVHGLTQREMAERAKLAVTFVSQMEAGSRAISLRSVDAFAGVLGCQAWELLKELDAT